MIKQPSSKLNNMPSLLKDRPYIISIPLALLFWFLATHFGFIGASLLAHPGEVGHVLAEAFKFDIAPGQNVLVNALATIERAVLGWGLSVGAGVICGLILGVSSLAYKGTEPLFEFARAVPPIMVFPVFLVAFNYGERAYIWTIVYGCFPIVLLTVARGVQRISKDKREILRIHNVHPTIQIFAIVMETLPSCFLGARLSLSVSLIVAVVTEMVFSPRSGLALGALAKDAEMSFETPLFYAAITIIGAFGYFANMLIKRAEEIFLFNEITENT